MKNNSSKILVGIATIAMLLLTASCRNFQQRAEHQMAKTLKETADPNAQLHDLETVFSSDSLVILNGTLSGVGHSGRHIDMRVEYVYGLDADGHLHESLFDIDARKSVITRARELRDSIQVNAGLKHDSIQCIRDVAWIADLMLNGRVIK